MAKNKKRVCKECGRLIIEEKNCPICKSNQIVDKYKGRVLILDAENSEIAEKINAKENGNYAMKY